MHRKFVRHITTFLFLVTFLVPRVADVHAFDHLSEDEDTTSCELCDIVSLTQQLDLFLGDILFEEVTTPNLPSEHVVQSLYNSPLAIIATPTSVYNKPPPSYSLG